MFRKLIGPLLAVSLTTVVAARQQPSADQPRPSTPVPPQQAAPEKIDSAMNAKIRAEETNDSKIMWIEHYLADDFGPRPIGSPNHKAAAEWAVKTMTSWGMKNAHLEPFTWRGVGWLPGKATGFMTAPVKANLKLEAVPWSPSTKGTISGHVVAVVAPVNPTDSEMTAYLVSMAPRVKGGIVMTSPPVDVPVNFNEPQKRRPPADSAAARGRGGRGAGAGGRGGGRGGAVAAPPAGHLSAQQVTQRITTLLRDNPPGLRLTENGDPRRIPGVIVAQNGAGQIYNDTTPQTPAVILRNDDYGRIYRIIADGTPVSAEFNIQNQYFHSDTSYVTVGEIPGTDKADEVVMMGGHLDSWTSATGATDNAIGCAVMMEAARILETIGAKPRRTIRVALWSGEEEGLLGSFAYVANHFGSAEQPKPDFAKLDAYWNIDDGTGMVRGAGVFGPPEAATVISQILAPFKDLGFDYGASASTARVEGGSDNGAFAVAGLPGMGGQQDPIEYNSTTWHTNLDTYDRIIPEDVEKNAVISASLMIHLANRDAMLPRFAPDKMPAVPPARGGGAGPAGGRGAVDTTALGKDADSAALAAAARARAATPPGADHVYALSKGEPLSVKAPGLAVAGGGGGRGGGAGGGRGGGRGAAATETAIVDKKPAHGTLALRANGSFTYTPTAGYAGTDAFTYKVMRGGVASVPATVTIVVK